MRKVNLRMNEEFKYKVIKKLVEIIWNTIQNKNRQKNCIRIQKESIFFSGRRYFHPICLCLQTIGNTDRNKFSLCINNTKSVFEKQPDRQKINLTLAILAPRIVDSGHSIKYKNRYYRFINKHGCPIYFGKGTKCIVIESFDKKLYVSVENTVLALEEIPEVQNQSENFDEIEKTKERKIYIPRMNH